MKTITGQNLNSILKLNAEHALYSQSGEWYHHLKKFPGVLFDQKGFLYFKTKDNYEKNKSLQHGKDLNIDGGISSIGGYKYFTKSENEKINLLVNKIEFIEEVEAWNIFLQNARKYEVLQEIFISPSEHRRYQIISTKKNIVKVARLDTSNSYETIGRIKFTTCIKRINEKVFPIKKGSIYEHVAEEVAVVELLPDLDWNEKGNNIINTNFNSNKEGPISEAKNDNINEKEFLAVRIRRGQKKLREKLFYHYDGKCAITNCNVKEVLHACHINSFANSGNNISTNAILLRSDIHDLFDANLIAINPDTKQIAIHGSLTYTLYSEFDGQFLKERNDKKEIDLNALNERWKIFTGR